MKIEFIECAWRASIGEFEAVVTDISSLPDVDKPFRLIVSEPKQNKRPGEIGISQAVSFHSSKRAAFSIATRWLGKKASL
jgi:hypothetical protein